MIDLDLCSADEFLLQRRSLQRELQARNGLRAVRVAVLGGSTTNQFVSVLEVLLLHSGFRPVFHQGEYGRFYEDTVHDAQALIDFRPDVVYLHTSCYDVRNVPPVTCTEPELPGYVEAELARWRDIWEAVQERIGCQIVQNNFETPATAVLGNMDAVASGGFRRFLAQLNLRLAEEIGRRANVVLQDLHSIASGVGVRRWFDWDRYFSYKVLLTPEAQLEVARSLASLVRAIYGQGRKVLVLDLDNTLWGGVIGDDGVDRIQIGRETPQAEAYTAFQEYCLQLKQRGVLLAVCSKNEDEIARGGFLHPDSVLKLEDLAAFKANWQPKHENLLAIAQELNLGIDSFVFVDDNPAEREIVRAQLPGVAVPEVGNQVTRYAEILEAGRYFEPAALLQEDLDRTSLYAANAQREAQASRFADYGEYLDSLQMTAEIETFQPVYLERIAQLTNKTNQFNLTTRRYTLADIEAASKDPRQVALYGRLSDRFGDNGLISVVLGHMEGGGLHLDLWLMSCRVLKRDMEQAMLDAVADHAQRLGAASIFGYYLPTKKNAMVAQHYEKLGFAPVATPAGLPDGSTAWELPVAGYQRRNTHIQVFEVAHA